MMMSRCAAAGVVTSHVPLLREPLQPEDVGALHLAEVEAAQLLA